MLNFVKGLAIAVREDRNPEGATRKVVVLTSLHFLNSHPTVIEIYPNKVEVYSFGGSMDFWSYYFESGAKSFIKKYLDGYFDPSMVAYNDDLFKILGGMSKSETEDLMAALEKLDK